MEKIKKFFSATNRRNTLDKLLLSHLYVFSNESIVLDIGGRSRGLFNKPKDKVKKWIFADIEPKHNPDIVLDVMDMKNVASDSIDIILATELFEHVAKPETGLKECLRVLKKGGLLILSVPFLYRVHADPFDFQRWTDKKWQQELEIAGLKIDELIIMGRYFSVMADNYKMFIWSMPPILKYLLYILVPIAEVLSLLDRCNCIKDNKILGSFHGGYFIKAIK